MSKAWIVSLLFTTLSPLATAQLSDTTAVLYAQLYHAETRVATGDFAAALAQYDAVLDTATIRLVWPYELAAIAAFQSGDSARYSSYADWACQLGSTGAFTRRLDDRGCPNNRDWAGGYLDTLAILDQYVLRRNKYYRDIIGGDSVHLGELVVAKRRLRLPRDREAFRAIQQYALDFFIRWVSAEGWPAMADIGAERYRYLMVFVFHTFRLAGNDRYHPLLFDAMEQFTFEPRDFGLWYPQYARNAGITDPFVPPKDADAATVKAVDARRYRYGLRSLAQRTHPDRLFRRYY